MGKSNYYRSWELERLLEEQAKWIEVKKETATLVLLGVVFFLMVQQVSWSIWGDEPIFKSHSANYIQTISDNTDPACLRIKSLCEGEYHD